MNLLVVEDDAQLADLLGRVLQEEGHATLVCNTLKEAQAALATESFDLVVLDWMLPDGEGLDLCARLRNRQPPLPVLMLTARGEVHGRVLGLRTGADDYMTKPFEVDQLLSSHRPPTLERALAHSCGGRWRSIGEHNSCGAMAAASTSRRGSIRF